jgi:hypothetical protein
MRSAFAPARSRSPAAAWGLAASLLLSACDRSSPAPLLASYPQPVQQEASVPAEVPLAGGARATLRASYTLTAHVMSVRDYDDAWHEVLPRDFALAWGEAASARMQENLSIRQYNRWFFWRWEGEPGQVPAAGAAGLAREMANVHIAPASAQVAAQLADVDPGDSVTLAGYLADIAHPQAGLRLTSLSRTDSGAGACELMLVERVTVLRH